MGKNLSSALKKMGKNQMCAVKNRAKIKGPLSEKSAKKSKVCCQRNMAQNQMSAIREKWENVNDLQSDKNGKKLKVCGQRKMEKIKGPR